jgi:predicted metalloprotease
VTKIRSRDASQISDRRGQGGGGGFGFPMPGGGGGGLPFPTKAGGGILGIIIVLAALLLPKLLSGGNQAVPSTGDQETTSSTGTCETDLEQQLCGATIDVQDYWTRAFPNVAAGAAYEPTKTVFFSQYTDTGCGQATSQVGPFYCPLDRHVYFDLDFLVQLQEQFGATGDLAAQYIVAHEFGHHVQNLLGTNEAVNQAQQQGASNANELSVALELQADCYAGAWAYDAFQRELIESAEVTNEAINAAEAVGDDRIQQRTQGRIDPESWTHGSADQRAMWFRRGFESGDPTRCTTFEEMGL